MYVHFAQPNLISIRRRSINVQTSQPALPYLGPSDEPCSQYIITYHCDSWLVSIKGDVAFTIHQVKDSHSTILITNSDMDTIRWRTEECHLVFLPLQDQNLRKGRKTQLMDGIWFWDIQWTYALNEVSPSLLFEHPRWRHAHMLPQPHSVPSLLLWASHTKCWLSGCQLLQRLRLKHSAGIVWSNPWPAALGLKPLLPVSKRCRVIQ